jgi:hypothetical protein
MVTVGKAKFRKGFEVGNSDNARGAGETPKFSKMKWGVPEVSSSNHNPEGSEGVSEPWQGSGSGDEFSDGNSLVRFLQLVAREGSGSDERVANDKKLFSPC